ncbi:MAG: RNA methyltransferase [Flavobacteriaceae bacterium]
MVDLDLLAYLEGFITPERKARILKVLEVRTKYITVAMEDVFQMHNSSAVVRSCEVFGIQDAHVIEGRFGRRLDKNIAMGAQQWVDVMRYDSSKTCLDTLRENGYRIVATTPDPDSRSLNDFQLESKIALFFGTEKEGLSKEILKQADGLITIPMFGFTNSLNISVSAAIILQHLTSQLRNTKLNWRLSESEILEKRLEWTKKSVRSIEDVLARYHGLK